jgi:hypothetical protein
MGRAPVLGGRRSLVRHNNQPKDSVGGGKIFFEETRPWRNVWGGLLLIVMGGELSVGKIENKESDWALNFDGSAGWGDATTNQKSVETMEYILGRGRAG